MSKAKSAPASALKYKDLLLQSSQEKEEQEVQFRVEEMQQSLDGDILATKRSLASEKAALIRFKSQFPLNTETIVNTQIRIESLEDGLSRLNQLREELF